MKSIVWWKKQKRNKAADDAKKAEVETRNKADAFIAQIDAMLEDNKDSCQKIKPNS